MKVDQNRPRGLENLGFKVAVVDVEHIVAGHAANLSTGGLWSKGFATAQAAGRWYVALYRGLGLRSAHPTR